MECYGFLQYVRLPLFKAASVDLGDGALAAATDATAPVLQPRLRHATEKHGRHLPVRRRRRAVTGQMMDASPPSMSSVHVTSPAATPPGHLRGSHKLRHASDAQLHGGRGHGQVRRRETIRDRAPILHRR